MRESGKCLRLAKKRLRSFLTLLRLGQIFSCVERVSQIVSLCSSFRYCSSFSSWRLLDQFRVLYGFRPSDSSYRICVRHCLTLLSSRRYRMAKGIYPCDAGTLWNICDQSASGLYSSLLHHVFCFSTLSIQESVCMSIFHAVHFSFCVIFALCSFQINTSFFAGDWKIDWNYLGITTNSLCLLQKMVVSVKNFFMRDQVSNASERYLVTFSQMDPRPFLSCPVSLIHFQVRHCIFRMFCSNFFAPAHIVYDSLSSYINNYL